MGYFFNLSDEVQCHLHALVQNLATGNVMHITFNLFTNTYIQINKSTYNDKLGRRN